MHGFQIQTPEVDILPGQEITYCYYFRTPNTETLPVRRFASEMDPVTTKVMMFRTSNQLGQAVDVNPPGTLSAADCGILVPNTFPRFAYEAHTPSAELTFPSDDGNGSPLALEIAPLSSGYLVLRQKNATSEVQKARVTVNVEALAGGVYTKTETFTGYQKRHRHSAAHDRRRGEQDVRPPGGRPVRRLSTHTQERAVLANIIESPNELPKYY